MSRHARHTAQRPRLTNSRGAASSCTGHNSCRYSRQAFVTSGVSVDFIRPSRPLFGRWLGLLSPVIPASGMPAPYCFPTTLSLSLSRLHRSSCWSWTWWTTVSLLLLLHFPPPGPALQKRAFPFYPPPTRPPFGYPRPIALFLKHDGPHLPHSLRLHVLSWLWKDEARRLKRFVANGRTAQHG